MPFGNAKVQRPGRKLLIAAMAATFGMGLSGCNDDNNSSNNGPGLGGQNSPKGTLIGTVLDTNGNPIAGATVTIGTRSQTTNSAGSYQFDNLAVTDAVLQTGLGGSSGSGSANNVALPLVVQAPAGFLGGSTSVKLNSQFSCSEVTNGGGQTNPQCVLIDGFNVGAGALILPATTGTLTGVLRNQITGEIIANQALTLDFAGLKLDQNNAAAEGFQASGAILTTTTAADGTFSFANVAVDSCYDLRAANLDLNFANNDPNGSTAGAGCGDIDPAVDANELRFSINEGANTALLVQASPISTEDLTQPFVTRVAGVIDGSTAGLFNGTGGPAGQLQIGVNSVLTSDFREALVAGLAAGQNDVVVTVGTGVNTEFRPSTVTIVDSNTITVTLATPIADGTVFNIDLLRDTFRDTSGNPLNLNAQNAAPTTGGGTGSNNPGTGGPNGGPAATQLPVAYDSNVANGYVRLKLRTFSPLDIDTGGATVTQGVTPVNPSTDSFFAATQALADFIPGTGTLDFADQTNAGDTQDIPIDVSGIEQLNAVFTLDTANGQPHPLQALADILDDRILGGSPGPVVDVAAAAANITFGTADHYLAWVEDRNGNTLKTIQMSVQPVSDSAAGNPRIVGTLEGFQPGTAVPKSFSSAVTQNPGCNNPTAGIDNCPIFVITKGNATAAKIYILDSSTGPFKPLRPGAVLKVLARSSSGFTGSEISVPLVDAVAPTAGAQFFAGTAGALNSANSQNSGSGGTTINLTTATGQVIYPITPQALELVEDAGPGTNGLIDDTLAEVQAVSNPALTNSPLDPSANGNFIADAAGTTAFLGAANRGLGLVVTEPTAPIPGAAAVLSAGSTATVTNIGSINNGVDELNKPVNLLSFQSNVLALETDGRANNRTIDFSPTFTDTATAPNQANRAIVNVRDFLPPFMTKAFFDGRQFVFRFHEAVRGDGTTAADIIIECGLTDVAIDVDASPAGSVLFGDSNRRIIVPLAVNSVPNTAAILSQPATGIANACFNYPSALSYAEGDQYTLATLVAAGDTSLPTVAAAPPHGAVTYPLIRDRSDNSDLGVAPGNSWQFWASQDLGMGDSTAGGTSIGDQATPLFAIANILPPFVPQAIARGNNYTSAGNGNGLAGQNINITVTTSTPFFLTDGVAGSVAVVPAVGPDADSIGNDNVLTQAELNTWAAAKFQLHHVNPDQDVMPTSVQILDSNGQDVTTTSGNNQQAQTIILTFALAQNIEAGDTVRLIGGQGLASQFDPTNVNIVIRPFDQGLPNAANGTNDRNELAPIPPLPQVYTCPQVGVTGTVGEC